jgi:membrane protein implicated in regulation of membrane protease activity
MDEWMNGWAQTQWKLRAVAFAALSTAIPALLNSFMERKDASQGRKQAKGEKGKMSAGGNKDWGGSLRSENRPVQRGKLLR